MSAGTELRRVAVYCGSSGKCDPAFLDGAEETGRLLAEAGAEVVYGGGSNGLMGRLADGALAAGGAVTGVIPRFMVDVEWAHDGLTDLRVVDDMHTRKRTILDLADAVVALPGGCGTLEELLEAITWKRLGLFTGPIVIVNQGGFYGPCIDMLQTCVRERFMNPGHVAIWRVAPDPTGIIAEIEACAPWGPDAIRSAPVQ